VPTRTTAFTVGGWSNCQMDLRSVACVSSSSCSAVGNDDGDGSAREYMYADRKWLGSPGPLLPPKAPDRLRWAAANSSAGTLKRRNLFFNNGDCFCMADINVEGLLYQHES